MKKIVALLLFSFISIAAYTQDLIITKNGDKIDCIINKEDSATIYFGYYIDDEWTKTQIDKDQISSYNYCGHSSTHFLEEKELANAKAALSIGFFQGGSLVGTDFEYFFGKNFGAQLSAGLGTYGAGANFHFKSTINSSFLSLQFWNALNYAKFIGPAFIYRGNWTTAQIGLAKVFDKSTNYKDEYANKDYVLLYSIGIYFPLFSGS